MKKQAIAGLVVGYLSSILFLAVVIIAMRNALALAVFLPCLAVPSGMLGAILGVLVGQSREYFRHKEKASVAWSGGAGCLATIILAPFLFIMSVMGLALVLAPAGLLLNP